MSTRKPSPQKRALRPRPERLEDRQLLAATVSGTDADGDTWVLSLIGPGTLSVAKQDGEALDVPSQIRTITAAATNTLQTRLVGNVNRGPQGDGRVFFQDFRAIGGGRLTSLDPDQPDALTPNNGILAIDMPDFWLGLTEAVPSNLSSSSIEIPDGIITLRFGGVDTTAFFGTDTTLAPNLNNEADSFRINLGLPSSQGTSVIVDRVISSAQPGVPSSQGAAGPSVQDSVVFLVEGRLNLFQANAIEGNASLPPPQFENQDSQFANEPGGTVVLSRGRGITAQIGDVRIGGNATNFTALAFNFSNLGDADAKVGNFSIGGETDQVLLVAPGGSRNVVFGRGMDRVTINSDSIETLEANRGALDSTVTVNRHINQVTIGGDVVDTNVQAGYSQSLGIIANNVLGVLGEPGRSSNPSVTPPPTIANRQADAQGTFSPLAQNGGDMTVLVAGDVVNSVFSASVEPNPSFVDAENPGVFGDGDDLRLPVGTIRAKVEGTIDNSFATLVAPEAADRAFFARHVDLETGPVIPPSVPEPPFSRVDRTVHAPRVRGLRGPGQLRHQATPRRQQPQGTAPRGPRATMRRPGL